MAVNPVLMSLRTKVEKEDAINLPGSGFCRLPKKYCEDSKELTKSLGKLASIRVRAITFAHGLPIVADAGERLLQVINSKV